MEIEKQPATPATPFVIYSAAKAVTALVVHMVHERGRVWRLNALSLIDSATEVTTDGFGPDSPAADDHSITLGKANFASGPTANGISYDFAPDRDSRSPALTNDDLVLRGRIAKLVADCLQELEHASRVRC